MGKMTEVTSKEIVKDLGVTDFGKDDDAQLKAAQLMKGLALSKEPIANKFMQALSKASEGIAKKLLGEFAHANKKDDKDKNDKDDDDDEDKNDKDKNDKNDDDDEEENEGKNKKSKKNEGEDEELTKRLNEYREMASRYIK